MRGVVAAGHPLSAEAGAAVLREGGNAVDAAVCAVLASFAVESPLTGFGAGGHMMVHEGGETTLIDFFVAAPGLGRDRARTTELVPVPVRFDAETTQTFYVGPASCGVPGTAAGLAARAGSLRDDAALRLVGPGVRLAREGAPVNRQQAYILEILAPIHEHMTGTRELYAPAGRRLGEGDVFGFPELAEALERYAEEGAELFYKGEVAAPDQRLRRRPRRLHRPRRPRLLRAGRAQADRHRLPRHRSPHQPAALLRRHPHLLLPRPARAARPPQRPRAAGGGDGSANSRRDLAFAESLYEEGMEAGFLDPAGLDLAAADLLGSTTHISVLDAEGNCASVTCSNGSGSGVLVPGTGVILNNMLGEEDLNPAGFHLIAPGRRVPSMMAPTVVLRDGEIVLCPRQRRLQPDPLGDPADGGPRGRAGVPGRRRDRGVAAALRAGDRPGRAGDRRGRAATDRGARRARWRGGRRSTSSSAASRRWRATPERRAQRRRRSPSRRSGRIR